MTGARRHDDVEPGRDPYRVPGHGRPGAAVTADAVLRVLVGREHVFALDDQGRAHGFDASGAIVASVAVGPLADAALHDEERALAVASYGRGVTSLGEGGRETRFVEHPAAVLACVGTSEGLVVGDQAGGLALLVPERGAARAEAIALRAPILSIAVDGPTLAVVTEAGEALVGGWPRSGSLSPVRGLRADRPFHVAARPLRSGFAVVDRVRVHDVVGSEVERTSRDFDEGVAAYVPTVDGGWLLEEDGKLHHLDTQLRAAPVALDVAGRPRGLAASADRALVWTTRGELVSVAASGRARLVAKEGVLSAATDARSGEIVALTGGRALAVSRYARS
ncbi:MAG: hypothetical protein U0234_10035 [Sandaracinus sp.]